MTNTDDMYVFTLTHYKCTYSHLHIIRPFLSLPFTYTFLNVVLLKMANSRIQIIFIIKDEFRFLPNLDLRQKRASQQNCIFFFFSNNQHCTKDIWKKMYHFNAFDGNVSFYRNQTDYMVISKDEPDLYGSCIFFFQIVSYQWNLVETTTVQTQVNKARKVQ